MSFPMTMLDFGGPDLAWALCVLAIASYVRGYSGFGFSAVLVAGLSFVMDPVEAVPLAILFEVLASVVQGRSVWGDIRWSDCGLLLLAAIIGNPIGVLLLTGMDQDVLRGATFIVLAILTATLLKSNGRRADSRDPTSAMIFAVGVIAGVVNGATAMSGLVLVLAMSFTVIKPAEMRATLVAYFFVSDIIALGVLGGQDELTEVLFWRSLFGLPIMALGVLIGSRAFRGTSLESFRRATLGLLLAISFVGLLRLVIS